AGERAARHRGRVRQPPVRRAPFEYRQRLPRGPNQRTAIPKPMSAEHDSFGALPALRCLGELADVRPTIVVDTREQQPLPFSRLKSERGTLATGDYSFRGGEEVFAIERKSVADLVGCCV